MKAEALLERWRATRAASDADALDALDCELAAPRGKGPFHRFWLALAAEADAAQVGWLAKTLFSQLPETSAPHDRRSPAWLARLEAIRRYAPDPRLSAAVAKVVLAAPFQADDRHALAPYGPVGPLLTADVRQAKVLERWLRNPRGRVASTRRALLTVAHQWLHECRRLGVDDRAEAKRAELSAAPLDPAARAVWADALIEAGDPRGEYIALSREGRGGSAIARKLLKLHGEDWFGALNRVLVGLEFKGGFLSKASLNASSAAEDSVWRRAVNHPELRTLETLRRARGNSTRYQAFLRALPWLEGVEAHGADVLELLLEAPARPLKALTSRTTPLRRTSRGWRRPPPSRSWST